MTVHLLDRPIRAALTTRHRDLAEGGPRALRYQRDISPFITAVDDSDEALAELGTLVPDAGFAILARADRQPVPPGAVAEMVAEAVQMVAVRPRSPGTAFSFLELSDADAPEMLELARLTKPGPFESRTHQFGGYIGIRQEGRLVAMAGQRLQAPGYTEVSAVCTHPNYRGRGYGSFLMGVVAQRILERGETPFLHAFASNTSAIRLYEQLGYAVRTPMVVTVLRRA